MIQIIALETQIFSTSSEGMKLEGQKNPPENC